MRILKQLAYLRKIWGRSGLRLDPIDMQIDEQSQAAGQKKCSLGLRGAAMMMTHPYVIGAGVMVVCLFGLFAAHTVYTPFFAAYEIGCANEVVEKRTGTFFSNQVQKQMLTLTLTLTLNLTLRPHRRDPAVQRALRAGPMHLVRARRARALLVQGLRIQLLRGQRRARTSG